MKFSRLRHRAIAYAGEKANIALLQQSPLFDRAWYVSKNPDVQADYAYRHYLRHGGLEGRAAGPEFDSRWYLDTYPDVLRAGINPLVHYLRWGKKEGRALRAAQAETAPCLLDHSKDSDSFNVSDEDIDRLVRERAMSASSDSFNVSDEDIDLLVASDLFDPVWYVQTNPQVRGQNPYHHFMTIGAREGLMASCDFDCARYLEANPDIAAAKINPLIHYLRHGIHEGRSPGLSAAKQWAVEQTVKDVKGLDPEIEACHQLFATHRSRLPVNYSMPTGRVAAVWRELFSDLPRQVDHLVFAPWLVRGGADLACVNVVRAAQQARGVHKVLLVLTDSDRLDAFEWLPAGTQVVVFSDYSSSLDDSDRKQIVESLIFALRPRSIMNVNSHACWAAIAEKGRALRSMTRLHAMLFCRDFTPDGRGAGFADTHFRACIHHLDRIYFDTRFFILEMAERYGLSEASRGKLVFLAQPILDDLRAPSVRHAVGPRMQRLPRVLWAGRFCLQKNTELLERIVRRMPDVSFDIWGMGEAEREAALGRLAESMPNVNLRGPFTSFSDLPLTMYSAYLFTSRFEGMPTVLINAAAAALPIVASNVGGVSELVTHETGWLVNEVDDEAAYCDALSEILNAPQEVEQRVSAMREKVRTERSWESFTSVLTSDSDFLQLRSLV